MAAVEVLERFGHTVTPLFRAVCCGQPFTNAGASREGEALRKMWWREAPPDAHLVVLSASCCGHLVDGAPSGRTVREFAQFLDEEHGDGPIGSREGTIALHASCHSLRGTSSSAPALRRVFGRIAQLQVHEPAESVCCGFGGTFSVEMPETSAFLGRERLRALSAAGVRAVTAADPSCLLHLEGTARAAGIDLAFPHPAEILAEALR